MALFNKTLYITTFLLVNSIAYSQNVASPYEVGRWQGFRDAAVCFTFDDGCPNQFNVALPIFNKYDFKVTLFTIVESPPPWNILKKAASSGHEIASHTYSHLDISSLSDAQQNSEFKKSQDEINAHIKSQKCLTIAYPYCDPGNKSLCKKYYIAARGCSGLVESSTPADFMNISSITCGTLGKIKTAKDFCNKADSAAASKGLVIFLIHGVDNDGGFTPITSENLSAAVDYMKSNQSKFWVSTFGNIVRYIKERNDVWFQRNICR